MNRIYHPWTKWECFKAGFFTKEGDNSKQERQRDNYVDLLTDTPKFEAALERVLAEWPNSCEQNLSNESMNRVAWLGQASCAILFNACAEQTRGVFHVLSKDAQDLANATARKYLNKWLEQRGEPPCLT